MTKSIDKEKNSTTFKQCGWCKYAIGLFTGNCCVTGKCAFLRYHLNDINSDTKCVIKQCSKLQLSRIIDDINRSVTEELYYIGLLKDLFRKAPDYPPTIFERPFLHFREKDKVALYNDNVWKFGHVVYTKPDDSIICQIEDKQFNCFILSPFIMLKWEFNFFLKNKSTYKEWCEQSYVDYDGEYPIIG